MTEERLRELKVEERRPLISEELVEATVHLLSQQALGNDSEPLTSERCVRETIVQGITCLDKFGGRYGRLAS